MIPIDATGGGRTLRDDEVPFPATTVLLCEQAAGLTFSAGPDPYRFDPDRRRPGEERGWERHGGGANYAFADGHVRWHRPERVGYNVPKYLGPGILGGNDGTYPSFARE